MPRACSGHAHQRSSGSDFSSLSLALLSLFSPPRALFIARSESCAELIATSKYLQISRDPRNCPPFSLLLFLLLLLLPLSQPPPPARRLRKIWAFTAAGCPPSWFLGWLVTEIVRMDFGVELGLNTRLPYFSRAALRSATIFCSPTLRVSVFFDKPDC